MAPRKSQKKTDKHLVIDAGNGNTKVSIGGESEVIPSLLSNNDGNYIRGGFTLADEQWILGWDNVNRADVVSIATKDTGKLDFLHLLLAGAISSMRHLVNQGDSLKVHVLTLNTNKRQSIEASVNQSVQGLLIDNDDLGLTVDLAGVYPEGYGAALYACSLYPTHKRVAVLDCGNGTLNLSQYFQANDGLPRRESFSFIPEGVSKFVNRVSDLLLAETSNGDVDESLIRQALDSNSYRYLNSYEGLPIWEHAVKASTAWSENQKVKQMLVHCLRLINSGVPVVLVGGGFSFHCLSQRVTEVLTSQGRSELLKLADEPVTIGVDGLAQRFN